MQLKNYQNKAIKKLVSRSEELLEQSGQGKLVFKSPTGSGKTIVTAEFLKQLVSSRNIKNPLSFIWTAPRSLHLQSKEKLEKYYEKSKALNCSTFEDLIERHIPENEILFLNWESINKKNKNTIVKENEKDFYLGKIIENTIDEGNDIILIIDESHHHATSDISKNLITDINPKLTIEVSATPITLNPDEIVSVKLEDVKIDGMIKKSIILNPNLKNALMNNKINSTLSEGTDAIVLKEALNKRLELKKNYEKNKIDVNPLLLIQLPDKKTKQDELIKQEVTKILRDEYSITKENGKLSFYLSEQKENLENISINNNKTEVLIFKQAIALGWDCPRAQILVLFRDWKSLTFSVQTVGRIMRMPEPELGHYKIELLNHGFVFTNLSNIEVKEDIARDYINIYSSKRINKYKSIKLISVYQFRQREKTRLSSKFVKIFLDVACDYSLEKRIKIKNQKFNQTIISDFKSEDLDSLNETKITGNFQFNTKNENDLQKLFDFFIKNQLSPFYPEERSIGRLKEAIYNFFNLKLNMDYQYKFLEIISIILSEANVNHFINTIDIAKEKYISVTKEKKNKLQKISEWEIPELLNFNQNHEELQAVKSAMQPFYYDNRWKPEKAFINLLEKSKEIVWWFKNGESDGTFFAIPYEINNETKPFYVDFIVLFKNNKIGLFDTKSGRTITDSKEKSDGLQKYINKHEGFIGGIVTNTNPKDFSGRWIYYNNKGKDIVLNDYSNWEQLHI